ncbi:MAG: bifunctional (p)ppGpp synthetase/guanosine-3',5'-bis(diphosphate) 3'-pyrophosphohydrolase [Synergistaceae bacterium]|nr:bifunctional (p)ppGpp synthetase/guanosine-3',5'-bis(diphosphate) 3'-pyrophosphohydrolase [Synergistaceae bacterium]
MSAAALNAEEIRSIVKSVPSLSGSEDVKEMATLRDAFYSQVPAESQAECVKSVWHELWSKCMTFLSPAQMHQLGRAFVFAAKAHAEQKRKSGEPYVIHVLNAALILAGMKLDLASLTAALLHDVLEDTPVTPVELSEQFGEEVVTLVDGVTKLGKLPFKSAQNYQAENIRKMFIVMAHDIRVVLIKLADRLHNMRTLGVMRRDKQIRIAKETLEIFSPLAHRLGISQIKRELDDLSFKYINPDMYNEIKHKVKKRLPEMESVVNRGIAVLSARLDKEGIACKIKGRTKHFYSIYEKMQRKKLAVDDLYDILAIRVLVEDVATCYAVLGIVHAIWVPIPGQFDDYIATPKNNMYQSLHTTVMAFGAPLEVQIRTHDMNRLAEYGIAAHWLYKTKGVSADSLDERLMWVRQAIEDEQGSGGDPEEFLDLLKSDFLTSEVYAFTPQGKPLVLPNGATTIDFAYAVHTEVGNHCVGAMINNRIVPLNTQLHSGDIVNIITSQQASPSQDWIKIVKSSKTRAKIRSYFKQIEKTDRDEKTARGWEVLERELRKRGLKNDRDNKTQEDFAPSLNKVAGDLGVNGKDELLMSIGSGNLGVGNVAQRLVLAYLQQQHHNSHIPAAADLSSINNINNNAQDKPQSRKQDSDILVEGEGGVTVQLANCCTPVPGDDIVGYSTKLRGITIHRIDCKNIINNSQVNQVVNVSWANNNNNANAKKYTARLKIEGLDRNDLFRDAAQAVSLEGGSIAGVKAGTIGNSLARIKLDLKVRNLEHLYAIIARLNEVKGILEVSRG